MAGTTAYPGGIDNFAESSPTNLGDSDGTGRTHSERHDDVEASIEAIETELGTTPSGVYDTVSARLDAIAGAGTASISLNAGTATAPSFYFTSDTNTGIWSPGADTLAVSTGGTERLRVNSAGSVGVATTTPNKTGQSAAITVNAPTATDYAAVEIATGNTLRGYISATNGEMYVVAPSAAALALYAGGSERLRIAADGAITGTGSLGAWTTWTPTVTAFSGTITTKTGTGRYSRIGKWVVATARIAITTNGTGAGGLIATLPVTAANVSHTYCGSGRENNVTGKGVVSQVVPNSMDCVVINYDNTYPGGDGYQIDFTVTYEAA